MSKEFFDTIKQGNLREVKRLLALDPNLIYERENGLSPVLVAAHHQRSAIAEFLTDKAGSLDIFEAASRGKKTQIVHLLARNPLLINDYAEDGFQPLGLACFFGHYETAEYLIKAGAALNLQSRNVLKAAPLHSAVDAGHKKIVALLLNNGADPNLRDQGGNTSLHIASQNGNKEIIHLLLLNGADLSMHNKDGKLAVDLASEERHTGAAALLREGITRRFRVQAMA
jgi:uncharacterized protein